MPIPLLIIVGPTASGKSKLSVELAKFYNGEIVSADSMQIYKYMDIGTAKITVEEKQGIPHYMIDVVEPNVKFSVAEFEKMAKPIINDIYERNKLPIVAGGTGLYIDSLIYIMNFSDYIGNDDFRSALKNIADVFGNDYLYDRLRDVDPKTYAKLHPNDLRRVVRALEVYQFTGKPISVYQELSSKRMNPEYDVIMIGLNFRDRNKLYKRIDDRVDTMLKNNLVNEVVNLLKIGYNKYDTSMQALGYKEIVEYLDGKVTFEEAIDNLKKRTRRYAKRQITWFKSYKIINWFYVDDYTNFEELKKNIISFLAGNLNFR